MTWIFFAFQLELISFRFKNAATFLSRMDLMYWFYGQGKDGQFEKTFPSASMTTNEGMGIRNHKNTSKAGTLDAAFWRLPPIVPFNHSIHVAS